MPWIELDDSDIYYVERGSGPPLLFLHGMTSCCEAWFQQFDAFSSTYRCIAYDSVNHGHSSNSPRDEREPDRADELERVLAALDIDVGHISSTAARAGARDLILPEAIASGLW